METHHNDGETNASASPLYRAAGVDTTKAEGLVDWLVEEGKREPVQTRFGETMAGIGGFASLFRPRFEDLDEPLLVSSTDGVGTKLLLALDTQLLDGIGVDLVAMCANDLLTLGAQPLFFLDYFASGQLDRGQFKTVLASIRRGLALLATPLLGGETAEMPGLYRQGHFDLAGFMVGVVERAKVLGPARVAAGDSLIGLSSSGFHSNGYSLIRSWLGKQTKRLDPALAKRLLCPTTIYHALPALAERLGESLHALAHITGGGIPGNLPRVMPEELVAQLAWSKIPTPDWMRHFIAEHGATLEETAGVFNHGLGMIAIVAAGAEEDFLAAAASSELTAVVLGEVCRRKVGEERPVIMLS